jgi:hypothetical protein
LFDRLINPPESFLSNRAIWLRRFDLDLTGEPLSATQ